MTEIVIDNFRDARDAYRQKDLRQGLYDAGAVVMAGVLVNLHGEEHKRRRRLENRMFRRETFDHYERDLFPGVMEQTLAPHLAAGRAELVHFGHALMLNLAAVTAGVDRPAGTAAETARLHGYVRYFIEGATLAHSTQDRAERTAVIAGQLQAWREEFLAPSIARRRELLDAVAAGRAAEEDLPRDVLTALLRHAGELDLAGDVLAREVAFFLLAGAHTSATAFVRTIDHALSWVADHPEDLGRLQRDRLFVQRCVHETIRLNPSSPVGIRRALAGITLKSGVHIPEGSKVVIDLAKVNRDPELFGPDADAFDPTRATPEGVAPYGLSFAAGMHVCIGQDLAAGVVAAEDPGEGHLTGLVPVAVQRMFQAGLRRDPDNPPEWDTTTARPYWASYPVLLGPATERG
ncbi:MAG: cytochrome P450 [Gemmatimonadota bacterium]